MVSEKVKVTQKNAFELMVLKFIDAYLDLYGVINSSAITRTFPIHRTKASNILSKYIDLDGDPASVRYSFRDRHYKKGIYFKKRYLGDDSSLLFINAVDIVFDTRVNREK